MRNAEKSCAYCGSTSSLTKEHVIPRFIYDRRIEKWDTFFEPKQRFFQGEPQIGDVCRICNSGRLSVLDAYVASIWDDYFEKIVMPGEVITFRYNFSLLASWLLKVSFNVARATKNDRDATVLERYVPYICGREQSHPQLSIYLELMTPYFLSPDEEKKTDPRLLQRLPRDAMGRVMLEPREIRPARSLNMPDTAIRLLSLHSYYFYLLLAKHDMPDTKWKQRRRTLREKVPSAEYLGEDADELKIRASAASFIASKMPHMIAHSEAYKTRSEDYLKSLGQTSRK